MNTKVTKVTTPHESATRRCMEAMDTIDHCTRWMKNNPFRDHRKMWRTVKTMQYFLWEYGHDERRIEQAEFALASLQFSAQALMDSFKPNTYRR
jgi:hypothetical protein